MNHPDGIAELERELQRVVGMVERDEELVARSKRPKVESIFLASSTKLRKDIQRRLRIAKAERAHEVVRLRLDGAHLATGTIPLRALANFIMPLNAVLAAVSLAILGSRGRRLTDRPEIRPPS